MTWLVAAASLVAVLLNIHRMRACFMIWFATNLAWAAIDFVHGLPAQALLMLVYAGLAIWGWLSWGRRPR